MSDMNPTYVERRQELTRYFDRTAAAAWERLTSDAPVGRVRATVRAGRDAMRQTLLDWLPEDLGGCTLLDAGCGTGALAIAAAERGARVTAVDVSPTLLDVAKQRTPDTVAGRIDYRAGDMLDADRGPFDFVVAMDSLIHYPLADMIDAIALLAGMAQQRVLTTFAPRTPALTVMHVVGRMLPHREHRAPAIEPASEYKLLAGIQAHSGLEHWQAGRGKRVSSGFYVSQAQELRHA
ncbi:MAG: magnesium protoporphyrin IX methyltransferase [Xanthomonadales bacterium]|jgi:magnesium-protoporphyrin O-methyltransferase|nr:magnesium protoporphyrin IX methyltransferase [Xanthomonadales bacterium]